MGVTLPISRWLALRRWHFLIHKEVSRRSRAKWAGASVTRGLALIMRGPQCKLCFVAKRWYSWQKKNEGYRRRLWHRGHTYNHWGYEMRMNGSSTPLIKWLTTSPLYRFSDTTPQMHSYFVKTPAAKPKSVLFALLTASSSVSNGSTVITGPNISSLITVISSEQSVITQGDM